MATPVAACSANSAGDTSPRRTHSASPTASCSTHSCHVIAKVIAAILAIALPKGQANLSLRRPPHHTIVQGFALG
jgi:hypothetical protein